MKLLLLFLFTAVSARSAGRSTSRSTARSTSGKKNKRKVKKTKPRTTTSDGEKLTVSSDVFCLSPCVNCCLFIFVVFFIHLKLEMLINFQLQMTTNISNYDNRINVAEHQPQTVLINLSGIWQCMLDNVYIDRQTDWQFIWQKITGWKYRLKKIICQEILTKTIWSLAVRAYAVLAAQGLIKTVIISPGRALRKLLETELLPNYTAILFICDLSM